MTATIDGEVVSWENNWFGPSATTAPQPVGDENGDMVFATIDGQLVSWKNNYHGPSTTGGVGNAITTVTSTKFVTVTELGHDCGCTSTEKPVVGGSPATHLPTSAASSPSVVPSVPDDHTHTYSRIGYYHAQEQINQNLVFLGNHGGAESGVFDL